MKEQKLIILQGIPASGKTTWARQFVEESPLTRVRVNRDDIRDMLGKYWVPEREELVSEIEESCVFEALSAGYTVVLDATNLNPKYLEGWESIANLPNVEIEYKKFTINLEEAIERDSKRDRPVTEKVIRGFYNKYNGNI